MIVTANDDLNRVVRAYAGQSDDALRQELASSDTVAGRMLRGVRTLAAAPLTLHGLAGLEEILAWEAARSDNADLNVDLNDPAPGLRQVADAAAQRVREGRRADAIELLIRTVRLALVHLGERHRDTPTYINALARLYYQAGDYETAGHGFERAVELRTLVMGPDDTDTAISMTGLARVREAEGHYSEAVELHRQALWIFEAQLGPGHPDTGVNLNDLGCALHTVGELAEARDLLERALAISREFDGPDDPNTAIILGNLGGVLESQGALERAKQTHEESLAIFNAAPEADYLTYRWALGNLASVVTLLGQTAHARELCERALTMQFGDSPDERLAEATLRNNLGMSYQMLGEFAVARTEFQAALDLLAPAISQEHPLVRAIRLNLARCATGDLVPSSTDGAAEWAAFQAALGTTHPPVALFGTTGIWIVPWEGLSFPVILTLAA
jgi:tetratricopeptide (TPR) repeat protein